jgi:DNA-binding response OmpR family regulator
MRARSQSAVLSSPVIAEKSTLRVLVVDDERLIRWSLRQGLMREGFGVEEAADGAATLDLLSGDPGRFAAVILDYRLPDRQDLSLLREIRRIAPATPVLMMTAFAEPVMRHEALALGAVDVIDKPFQVSAVISRIRAALPRPA